MCNELHELNPIYVKIKNYFTKCGFILYPSFTRTDLLTVQLQSFDLYLFNTLYDLVDFERCKSNSKKKEACKVIKIMNMYMILLESIHNDRCCIVLSNNTVRRVWLNYRLQFIKQLMVIQCSNMHVFHCSGRLELLCYSLKGVWTWF